MGSSNRPVARLGLALAAAVLGLATVTAVATADPTDTSSPPTSSSTEPTEPTEPSTEPSGPPSDPSAPPSSSSETPPPDEPPTASAIEDIEVTAEFHQSSYATGETIGLTLTLTNTGENGQRLDVTFSGYGHPDGINVHGFGNFGRDVVVPAGGSVTGDLTGEMLNPNVDKATLYVSMYGDLTRREVEFSVPVTRRVATASGVVYNDRDGDGNLDSGEGVDGARLEFTNKRDVFVTLHTTTKADGVFSIEVTPGDYYVDVTAPGMLLVEDQVTVPESGVDGLVFRTRQVLTTALGVDLEFTQDTYKPTDTPTVRVTLTNKGDTRLSGIVARCTHDDGSPQLTGTTASWGALGGEGLTLAPHTTTVLEVTEPMPPAAYDHGYVEVSCQFTYADLWGANDYPADTDRAAMPGQLVEVTGQINTYEDDADLTGFRVVLTAEGGACPIIAQATTGKDGKFSLGKVQAGRYHYYVVPPPPGWWIKVDNHGDTQVIAGRDNHWTFLAALYPNNDDIVLPPKCPGSPSANPPGPQAGPRPNGLAYTGASLAVPGIAGLLALVVGGATVFLSRRRRTDEEQPTD